MVRIVDARVTFLSCLVSLWLVVTHMRVIEISQFGPPDVLRIAERPAPEPGPGEVLIKVAAAGVNRPDVIQRLRQVPAAARRVRHSRPRGRRPHRRRAARASSSGSAGDAVCALVAGGGYAEYCVAPQVQCLRPPGAPVAGRGGGGPGNVLHGVDQRLRARPPAGGRDDARPRRVERHRHDGDPAGARLRRARVRHGGQRREVRRVPRARRRHWRSTTDHRLGAGVPRRDRRPRRRPRPRHGRRRLRPAQPRRARRRRPAGADRVSQVVEGRARPDAGDAPAADHHRLDAASALAGRKGRHRPRSSSSTSGRSSTTAASARSSTPSSRSSAPPTRTG